MGWVLKQELSILRRLEKHQHPLLDSGGLAASSDEVHRRGGGLHSKLITYLVLYAELHWQQPRIARVETRVLAQLVGLGEAGLCDGRLDGHPELADQGADYPPEGEGKRG